jgi:hypothetical protein
VFDEIKETDPTLLSEDFKPFDLDAVTRTYYDVY